MPTFSFRLASLLKLRESDRDQRRIALGLASQAERVLRERVAELEHELSAVQLRRARAAAPGVVRVETLREAQRYELALASRVHDLEQDRSKLAAEIERQRLALTSADRAVKVLEKLRDRQRAGFLQNQQRLETSRLDEAAAARFIAGGGGDDASHHARPSEWRR